MDKSLENFIQSLDTSPLKRQKEMKFKTFLIAFLTATAFFLPYIITGHGYFIFYGDFNVQQIPFYKLCHRMIREGNIFWDWGTDLGVNFIGSYSFYTLGSPFFWLTLPFPEWMLPYMMGPLLILKFSFAALTAYMYIRRFTKTPTAACIGGLLYAFSGFSVYNIFFNHFHEAIVFFPLLLLALELFITENRRGVLLLAVFACSTVNYFFFFGMVVFVIIYWFVRLLTKNIRITVGRFFMMLAECVLGLLLSAAILLPSVLVIMQNSRLDSTVYGWSAILHPRGQIYLNILEVFFFPPDIPARPVFFPTADVKWSSLGGWLPVFGLVGALTWMRTNKKHWINYLVWISLFMALVPILNSAFVMFNTAYYARWFYMPILILCLATSMACEDRSADWKPSYKWVAAITVTVTLVFGLIPSEKDENGNFVKFGLYTDPTDETYIVRFWVTCAIALISLLILRILLTYIKNNRRRFMNASVAMVSVISVIYAAFFVGCGVSHSYSIEDVMIPQLIEGKVDLPGDKTTYRIDVYDGVDNTAMFLGYSSINAFHSIVPGSVTEFYEYIGEERGVASRPETESYPIRSLLSVKYLINSDKLDSFINEDGVTEMPGFVYKDDEGGYKVFENEYYIPYGFTYDYYLRRSECDTISDRSRSFTMLKAIVLEDKDADNYAYLMKPLSDDYNIGIGDGNHDKQPLSTGYSDYIEDCKARAASSCYSFKRDNRGGFTANIRLEKDNLVFFSVPYENGWTAYVNGEKAEIVKANVGFMAVKAGAGDNEIRFTYETPGLKYGVLISLAALFISIVYIVVCCILKKKSPDKWKVDYPEGKLLRARFDRYDRDDNLSALEEKKDEIEEYYTEIDIKKSNQYNGRFEGGFTVDVTVLDRHSSGGALRSDDLFESPELFEGINKEPVENKYPIDNKDSVDNKETCSEKASNGNDDRFRDITDDQ